MSVRQYTVDVPAGPGVSIKEVRRINSNGEVVTYSYVNYCVSNQYDPKIKRARHNVTTIGTLCADDPTKMYPGKNYEKYFPEEAKKAEEQYLANEVFTVKTDKPSKRSWTITVGFFIILNIILNKTGIKQILEKVLGEWYKLFLDLVAHEIVNRSNISLDYVNYSRTHALFANKMHMYSPSTISSFYRKITKSHSVQFQELWNRKQDHRKRIYISYDSTNKSCQIGDLEFAEFGKPKINQGKPIISYSVAYDLDTGRALFYDLYQGSIVDVTQLKTAIETAHAYGYKYIGFVLDRGYFSEDNIKLLDNYGYSFVMLVKGKKKLVHKLVLDNYGSFEDKSSTYIGKYKVNGITVKGRLFDKDTRDRYFHVLYSDYRNFIEKIEFNEELDRMTKLLNESIGKEITPSKDTLRYFNLYFKKDGTLKSFYRNEKNIDEDFKCLGYFVIITSDNMTAEEAISLYKSRDASEKLFEADKTELGNDAFRVENPAVFAKGFIGFVALVLRAEMYTALTKYKNEKLEKKESSKSNKKKNSKKGTMAKEEHLTVKGAVRQLEILEITRNLDCEYRLTSEISVRMRDVFAAFGIDDDYMRVEAMKIGDYLRDIYKEEIEGGSKT